MEITARHEYDADPATVAAMLTDRAFWERVCAASNPLSYEVSVDGDRVRCQRVLPTPSAAAAFVKGDLTIVEERAWSAPGPDGTRRAELRVSAPGVSVLQMTGGAELRPDSSGSTVVEYRGDFSIKVPFVGKRLEKEAAPLVVEVLDTEQRVGREWLAERS